MARTGQALGPALMLGTSNNLLSRGAVGFLTLLIFGGSDPARFGTVIVSAMRQLSAVPWLSSGGRITLSILCVATLVCGVFGLLKISIGEKQVPNKELTTGSIQRSPAVRKPESRDPMAAFLVAPAVSQSTQRSTRSTTADPSLIPLPRPRPKRL